MKAKVLHGVAAAAVAIGLVTAWPATTLAEHHGSEFARPGAFVGLGANWQVEGFQGPLRSADFGNSWGFNARGGYRFFDWFALEGIFEYADDFGSNAPRTDVDLSLITTTANAKFIVPLERFQPYISTGIGLMYVDSGEGFVQSVEDEDVGFAGRIGGGFDLYLTPHVSLYVDNSWTMATENTENVYFYSLGGGARYNF